MKMRDILSYLKTIISEKRASIIEIKAVNPDISIEHYNGEKILILGKECYYRSYKTWFDISELLGIKFLTPILKENEFVIIRYEILEEFSLHEEINKFDFKEKYGVNSEFSRINKLDEPFFLDNYVFAIKRANLDNNSKILSLGVNRGDELLPILNEYKEKATSFLFSGIDHSISALEITRKRFEKFSNKFICGDINNLGKYFAEKFNLIIAIGLLQSPGIEVNQLVRDLVQNYSDDKVTFILGFPNSRYLAKEIVYGAKMKNFKKPDMSLLLKDIMFYKKYFQQHKFKVNITGKYYIFLTATREKTQKTLKKLDNSMKI